MPHFIHLHTHSYYSFLEGVSSPVQLVQAALENDIPALALTDKGLTREAAYQIVQTAAMKARASGKNLKDLIFDDKQVRRYLSPKEITQAFDVNFKDQQESDNIITDLETVLSLAREDFNVYPEERSEIFGDLTIEGFLQPCLDCPIVVFSV
jgi:DNA topoisomerase VI subunit A